MMTVNNIRGCMTNGYTGIREYTNGSKSWHLNGLYHRTDGPAVERIDGHKEWWLNGKHHREDGPAIIHGSGSKEWVLNGKHHREDGPAVERADGSRAWFLNGKEYTKEEYYKRLYKKGLISKEEYFLEFI